EAAVEDVGGVVAGQGVGQVVAGAVDRVEAGQGQILDVRGETEGDRALHQVGAAAGDGLEDDVERIVDDIGVVAEAAVHRVGAGLAVENVGAAVADQDVGLKIAGAVDIAGAGQGQVLDRH